MSKTSSTLLIAIVGLAMLAAPLGGVRAASVSESDIPGVPMTGSSISGVVGGLIVDRVYSISVPGASSLLISINGENGAELGLYLFSGAATSILSDTPLLVSAKPGGYQSISAQFVRASSVYININGRNLDRAYSFTLTIAILVDRTPPGIVFLEYPVASTSSELCVTVEAIDRGSRVVSIALSEELSGVELSWQPYVGRRKYCFTLGEGDGLRDFSIFVKNGVGITSESFSFSVRIDDTPPVVIAVEPTTLILLAQRGAVTWRFNEQVRLEGSASRALAVIDQNGDRVSGIATLSSNSRAVIWRPLSPVPVGSTLMCSLIGVVDQAGNRAELNSAAVVRRKAKTAISLERVWRPSANLKATIAVSANLVGREITLQSLVGRTWTAVQSIRVSSRVVTVRVANSAGSALRVVWEGSDRLNVSTSNRRLLPD